jgi:hypothetical protein
VIRDNGNCRKFVGNRRSEVGEDTRELKMPLSKSLKNFLPRLTRGRAEGFSGNDDVRGQNNAAVGTRLWLWCLQAKETSFKTDGGS